MVNWEREGNTSVKGGKAVTITSVKGVVERWVLYKSAIGGGAREGMASACCGSRRLRPGGTREQEEVALLCG